MRSIDGQRMRARRDVRVEGIGVSSGVAVGRVLRLDQRDIMAGLPADFEAADAQAEIVRLREAVVVAREQILAIKERVASEIGHGQAYFFEAPILMLEDRELLGDIERVIRSRRVRAEWAVKAVLDRMLIVYAQVKDDYLRERGLDIEDVARRVIRVLTGGQSTRHARLQHDVVIVANTLPPSTVAELDLAHVLGFATGDGGFTSHTAIIARSLGIPAVVGLSDVAMRVSSGEAIVVDGGDGSLVLSPTKAVIRRYLRLRDEQRRTRVVADAPPPEPRTLDGHLCTLRANVELTTDLEALGRYGAAGIGLYRSEFLYLNTLPALPSEDEQSRHFEQLANTVGDDGVTIRSFDLGGDKLSLSGYESERNPALGLRALRLALGYRPVFRTHLRAILRASAHGHLRIVFPMVATVSDLRTAKEELESCKEELRAEGKAFNPKIPVGAMIEVPSAVVIADHLAAECDFFSVGTNDLIQYLLAVDRTNQQVAHIYEPLNPSVLRSLKRVVDVATHAGIPALVCGEMASDPVHVAVLLGLGYDRFSMAPAAIPAISRVVRAVDRDEARALATDILELRTTSEIEALVVAELPRRFPDYFTA